MYKAEHFTRRILEYAVNYFYELFEKGSIQIQHRTQIQQLIDLLDRHTFQLSQK